jgi:hypothetical protein
MTAPLALGLILLLAPQEPLRDSGQVRRTLDRILASPEFETELPQLSAKETIWRWIARKIGELFDSISSLGSAAPGVFWTVLTILLLMLAGILIHGGVVVLRALRASRTRAGPAPGKRVRAEDAETLLGRAAQAAGQGRFTEAIRLCHRAALLGLDRRGFVRFQDCLTSGDYRAQLRTHEAERALFQDLTRIYEPASFGRAAAGGEDYAESLRLAQRLVRETSS